MITIGDYTCNAIPVCGWSSTETSRPLSRGLKVGCPNCQGDARFVGIRQSMEVVPGPFRYGDFRVRDTRGRILASMHMSARVPTDALNNAGKLLAASWNLRQLLRHVLMCSGTPAECEACKEAEAAANDEEGAENAED